MRRKLIAFWLLIVFLLMASFKVIPIEGADNVYHYFINNFYAQTGSLNAVSAIYLDYRVFDTLFETLLLLVSVIGIIYFSRHEGDY